MMRLSITGYLLLFLTGCAAATPGMHPVHVRNVVLAPNMEIAPRTLTAAPGETVSITNDTNHELTISFDPDANEEIPERELPLIPPSILSLQTVTFRLNVPGEYVYRVSSPDIVRAGPVYGRITVKAR